ncbi:uncharacterized protein V1516DRAFT_518777 [Lipomyces oligophaga]|uniref:uncharacterized protein n=1 Tax=Lipomyces oligophaga TaxID=45792 RepID=UPI0034CEF6D0
MKVAYNCDDLLEQLMATTDQYTQECLSHSSDCEACIAASAVGPCGWCPSSHTCVPDPSHLGILAAIRDRNICPYEAERFEFRARSLGCHVSSFTLWSTVLSFVIGILFVLSIFGLVAWLARPKVLQWAITVLEEDENEKDAEHAALLVGSTSDFDSDYQATSTYYRSAAVVKPESGAVFTDEEEDEDEYDNASTGDELSISPSTGFIYNPQTRHHSPSAQIHQSPRAHNPRRAEMYEKYKMPEDEELGCREGDHNILRRLSIGVREFLQ